MATDSLRSFVHDSSAVAFQRLHPSKPAGIEERPVLGVQRWIGKVAALAKGRKLRLSPLKEELFITSWI
jgi:hypothetical protein